jgi:hypothetical protein
MSSWPSRRFCTASNQRFRSSRISGALVSLACSSSAFSRIVVLTFKTISFDVFWPFGGLLTSWTHPCSPSRQVRILLRQTRMGSHHQLFHLLIYSRCARRRHQSQLQSHRSLDTRIDRLAAGISANLYMVESSNLDTLFIVVDLCGFVRSLC